MGLVPQKQCLGSTALNKCFLRFTVSLEKCDLHWHNLYLTFNYKQKTIRWEITFSEARVPFEFNYLPVKLQDFWHIRQK